MKNWKSLLIIIACFGFLSVSGKIYAENKDGSRARPLLESIESATQLPEGVEQARISKEREAERMAERNRAYKEFLLMQKEPSSIDEGDMRAEVTRLPEDPGVTDPGDGGIDDGAPIIVNIPPQPEIQQQPQQPPPKDNNQLKGGPEDP